jgi:signal transduction histidine kinase
MLLSQQTVRSHLRHVFRKLGVRSRVELARMTEQAATQARIIDAIDDTRQRIERDLHDGLQQRLVTLGLQVRTAEVSVPPSDVELKWELARVAEGLMGVLQDVREISRGIHPAILKHANAGMGEVFVEAGRRALSLSVRDDGVGGADPRGSGLAGLRERAEALGGTLELTSPPGAGTSVRVRLPTVAR